MRRSIARIAVVAALLGPALAMATVDNRVYKGNTASDSLDFELDFASIVSVGYSWSDFRLTKNKYGDIENNASSLSWILTGTQSKSGSFIDISGVLGDSGVIELGELSEGSYHLSFVGSWDVVSLTGSEKEINGWNRKDGHVYLDDDSLTSVAAAAPAATVPEPATTALLLSSLGLLGLVARRRK